MTVKLRELDLSDLAIASAVGSWRDSNRHWQNPVYYPTRITLDQLITKWFGAKKEPRGIIARESEGYPRSVNLSEESKDVSINIGQINFHGDLLADRLELFSITTPAELLGLDAFMRAFWILSNGGTDWKPWDIDGLWYDGKGAPPGKEAIAAQHRIDYEKGLNKYPGIANRVIGVPRPPGSGGAVRNWQVLMWMVGYRARPPEPPLDGIWTVDDQAALARYQRDEMGRNPRQALGEIDEDTVFHLMEKLKPWPMKVRP